MEGGDTHKVRVSGMYYDKARPGQIEGPLGSGKADPIYLGGCFIELAHGFDKFFYRFQGAAAEMPQQETYNPDPKSHKVQVYVHLSGCKGDLLVQGMVGPDYRITALEKSRPVLEEKEIPGNGSNT
jgi:hypothetical protein